MSGRAPVSVIVPFRGSAAELLTVVSGLRRLRLGDGDELLVADNGGPGARVTELDGVGLCAAGEVCAPGYARNRAARMARGEWLVFIDADTDPVPWLLDAYFQPLPDPSTAVLAGGIVDIPGGRGLAARHSAARGHMSHRVTLERAGTPFAQTANCAVRREAFLAMDGFDESVRAGEDADLCFRLARAGWRLEGRPAAAVEHRSRQTLAALLSQLIGHGAGAAWLNQRYPGEFPPLGARGLAGLGARTGAAALRAAVRGQAEQAALALLDFGAVAAFELGRLRPNRAPVRD